MDDYVRGLQDYLSLFSRRKWQFLSVAVLVFATSVVAAFLWPPVYRSTATVLIEEPEVPRALVQSTITSFADQRIHVIAKRVMTTQNLMGIIEKYDLFAQERGETPLHAIVDRFRRGIDMRLVSADVRDPRSGRATQATIAFTLAFEHGQPKTAQQVVNELVNSYLAENLRERTRKATDTTQFLEQEAERLNDLISEIERRLSAFKQENAGKLPEQLEVNLKLIDRLGIELLESTRRLQSLEEQSIFLNAELSKIDPYLPATSDGLASANPGEQLAALRTELVRLRGAYAPDHPDVVRLRREVSALETELGVAPSVDGIVQELASVEAELALARQSYREEHPDVVKLVRQTETLRQAIAQARRERARSGANPARATNPAFIQLRAQRQAVGAEIESLRGQIAGLRETLALHEDRVLRTPEVERKLLALMRDYENARTKYQEVKNKQSEAQLAQSLETESKGERFSLIEPAQEPLRPIKPNRPAILLLGFVLALGSGIGLVLIADMLDQSVYGPRQLASVTGSPPLAVVTHIQNPRDRLAGWLGLGLVLAFVLVLVAVVLGLVHSFVMPLDVVWSTVWQRSAPLEVLATAPGESMGAA